MKKLFQTFLAIIISFSLIGCASENFYRTYLESSKEYFAAYKESPRTELNFREDGTLEGISIRDPMERRLMPETIGDRLLQYALPLGLGLGSMYFGYLNNKEAFNFASGAFTFGGDIASESFANEPLVVDPVVIQ